MQIGLARSATSGRLKFELHPNESFESFSGLREDIKDLHEWQRYEENMTGPKSLRARFPYQFAGKNIGISTPRGWFSIFEELCIDIDLLLGENEREFHWMSTGVENR